MKTIIKNFFKILPFILAAWLISSCDNDDVVPKFTLSQASEDAAFSFSAADEYLISSGTMDNVAERFVWNEVDFGVQTEINYQLQGSIDNTFSAYDPTTEYDSGTLSVTNAEVKVSDLNNLATLLGLEAGDSGQVYFRARAFAGSGEGADAVDSYSDVMTLNISILEETSNEGPNCPSIWVVGAGATDAGWGWDSPIEFLCTDNVYKTNINLTNDAFRFFLTEGDWDSGQNFPFYVDEGYSIDSNFEDALDGDNNFKFIGTPGKYSLTVDTINKTIKLSPPEAEEPNCPSIYVVGAGAVDAGWGWDTPIEFLCTDSVYSMNINLTNDAFRFFLTEGDWDSGQNYPYYLAEGYTIDPLLEDAVDGDNNFKFNGTPGKYLLTVDTINKTITLGIPRAEEPNCDSVWVVGAGAVDAGWGWDTPIEFTCVDGVYSASINLINDAFRFFLTKEDWDSGQNFPFYIGEGYTIDSNFEDALDGDNNFRFIGTPGTYYLSVDTVNKIILLR
ncbi:SusE domain-containing protein [Maribacter luteus]|uniref:SusF/SusE family outer membrane protein n=1 Tax=Maribacter luteus TaxID=2594478 RepID=A0A6I2MIV2_9FLAO|nr:SusF/SusE family outer membrane protein [Maribacter luteus]MRX62777.1 SusF/SusE family outer membrane protein [Maribacter luteus]